jgi:hypothetical protein
MTALDMLFVPAANEKRAAFVLDRNRGSVRPEKSIDDSGSLMNLYFDVTPWTGFSFASPRLVRSGRPYPKTA